MIKNLKFNSETLTQTAIIGDFLFTAKCKPKLNGKPSWLGVITIKIEKIKKKR